VGLWAAQEEWSAIGEADELLPVGRGPGLAYGSRDTSSPQMRLEGLECHEANG